MFSCTFSILTIPLNLGVHRDNPPEFFISNIPNSQCGRCEVMRYLLFGLGYNIGCAVILMRVRFTWDGDSRVPWIVGMKYSVPIVHLLIYNASHFTCRWILKGYAQQGNNEIEKNRIAKTHEVSRIWCILGGLLMLLCFYVVQLL